VIGAARRSRAARLSEDPATRVLLLEAAAMITTAGFIPARLRQTFADPSSLVLRTEPIRAAADRRVWPRGKVPGGSSSINGMVYIRARPGFRSLASAGNTGWSPGTCPYFKRRAPDPRRRLFHGTDGPLCVSDVPDHHRSAKHHRRRARLG
jgi:choline dehydrogenase